MDTSIPPESLSHPSAAAEQALELCSARQFGIDKIERWGLIPSARQIPHYAPLDGIEPEIQTDDPAFVIQFTGAIPQLMYNGETWIDPLCVVIDGQPGFYGIGPRILSNGVEVTPPPFKNHPDRTLPKPLP